MNTTTYIYALIDPRNEEVRYVGQTINLYNRLSAHLRKGHNPGIDEWLGSLQDLGIPPQLVILEEVLTVTGTFEAEQWWMDNLRKHGQRLLNRGEAGPGPRGMTFSFETRERMRNAWTPERRKKNSERVRKMNKGGKMSEETRAKMRLAWQRRKGLA